MSTKRDNQVLHDSMPDLLKRMTTPMVFGMLFMMSFGLVDTYFVSLLGTDALAAISFSYPVTFSIISLNIGLTIGASSVVGRLLGQKNISLAQITAFSAISSAFILILFIALVSSTFSDQIFMLLGASEQIRPLINQYMQTWYLAVILLTIPMMGNAVLRASGETKIPSYVMASGGAINVILDPILIFGWGPIPAFGIQGAALATAIGWGIGVAVIVYILLRRQLLNIPTQGLIQWWQQTRKVMHIGFPAAIANMLTPVANGVVLAIVAVHGEQAVAAVGVGGRLETLMTIVLLSLTMSVPPIISQNFGAQQFARVRQVYRLAIKSSFMIQTATYFVVCLLAPWIAMLFTDNQQVAELIVLFIYIVPIGHGLQAIVVLSNSSFNAIHQPGNALILNIVRLFVFTVPLTYLGSYLGGLHGVFIAGVLANGLAAWLAYHWFSRNLQQQI